MSHYSAIAHLPDDVDDAGITSHLDRVLAPYNEYPDEPSPYTQDDYCEVSKQYIASIVAKTDARPEDTPETMLIYARQAYKGEDLAVHEGKLCHKGRINPNARWDWWQIGGRFSGPLLKSTGEPAVGAFRVGDIDFEKMRDEAEKEIRRRFALMRRYTKNLTPGPSWDELVTEANEDYMAAREKYWADPWVQAVRKMEIDHRLFSMISYHDQFMVGQGGEEAAIARARRTGGVPFVFISKDGTWNERAKMTMFARTYEETMTEEEWYEFYLRWLDEIGPEARLICLDMHT